MGNSKLVLAGAALLCGLLGVTAQAATVYVQVAPPAPRVEVVPPPRHGHSWVPGHWEWRHGRYVWAPGYWVVARRGYHFEEPRWVPVGNRWSYAPGRWVRGDRDRDGVPNGRDRDRDGDGVPNRLDRHPDNGRRN